MTQGAAKKKKQRMHRKGCITFVNSEKTSVDQMDPSRLRQECNRMVSTVSGVSKQLVALRIQGPWMMECEQERLNRALKTNCEEM